MFGDFIVIAKLTCQINTQSYELGKKLMGCSDLNAENIKNILARIFPQTRLFSCREEGPCVLNLGSIPADQFAVLFPQRLAQAFADYFTNIEEDETRPKPERLQLADKPSDPAQLLAELNTHPTVLYPLAICCLQPPALQQLLQSQQPCKLQQLLIRLLKPAQQQQDILPASFYTRVTASRLAVAALYYLLNEPLGEEWLSYHSPSPEQLNSWVSAIISGEISPEQIVQLLGRQPLAARLNVITHRWLLPLWQNKAVRDVVIKQAGRAAAEDIAAIMRIVLPHSERQPQQPQQAQQSSHSQLFPQATNAGLVLLWPLLPQLFSLLECCEDNRFIHDAARWQAVLSLDWLAWAQDQPVAERLLVNRLLCGIPDNMPLPELLSLSPEQQQLIDTWLTAVCQQLPGGQKLSINDLRALFLQRPGEINHETLPPQIIVHPEPFDYLLRGWPWPLTLASFPWLEQPLTVVWPVNGLTG